MNTTTVLSLILGSGAFLTAVFGLITQARDRDRSVRKQESDIGKLNSSIQLDETTRQRLAAEAAQIGADERIATERWWKEQFDAVKDELVLEQKLRRRLSKWAIEHQEWDKRAWRKAVATDPAFPQPPELEHD